ncbi:peptide-methionine (S)-S-oxide reductase MsrA [Litorivicinus lipolyticus]|uniref:Peptide methionine sulfoxide reductase MsrA n=1 Tax=Litorivicinus lipolyticus TaxID=418701 RepID=A0A5Q2QF07_9GAMM|nr:peptide-methionine (S)-S-oxide reductase MsrA [Litorivicinus lipolyticus]QGG80912.1 peptide-methionine (S)-S-oxide reductase MsrA [Litorivicinus lipolyticus]
MTTATFGAGCFWGVELTFSKLPGVSATRVGYMGGNTDAPNYQAVCTGDTYHAEVVEVSFDSARLDYDALLTTFFNCHDATQLNRQGPDRGTQYRSAIFVHDDEQRTQAQARIDELNRQQNGDQPIVTSVEPASQFWVAEDYHQKYLEKRGASSCGL